MTLTFNPLQAVVMTYLQAKVQGQRLVGSEDRVETNEQIVGRKEATALPPTRMKSVISLLLLTIACVTLIVLQNFTPFICILH